MTRKPLAAKAERALENVLGTIEIGDYEPRAGKDLAALITSLHNVTRLEDDKSTSNTATSVTMTREERIAEIRALDAVRAEKERQLEAVPEVHRPA